MTQLSAREKLVLLFVLGVAPLLLIFATFVLSFQRAERLSFCASCHTMTPWIADLEDPNSKSLAAIHYRNRFIVNDQCYTCHVNYSFFGPITTKVAGLRHVAAYYTGLGMHRSVKLYKPFPNGNCMRCHGQAEIFGKIPAHTVVRTLIQRNQLSCIPCHQPIHTPKG